MPADLGGVPPNAYGSARYWQDEQQRQAELQGILFQLRERDRIRYEAEIGYPSSQAAPKQGANRNQQHRLPSAAPTQGGLGWTPDSASYVTPERRPQSPKSGNSARKPSRRRPGRGPPSPYRGPSSRGYVDSGHDDLGQDESQGGFFVGGYDEYGETDYGGISQYSMATPRKPNKRTKKCPKCGTDNPRPFQWCQECAFRFPQKRGASRPRRTEEDGQDSQLEPRQPPHPLPWTAGIPVTAQPEDNAQYMVRHAQPLAPGTSPFGVPLTPHMPTGHGTQGTPSSPPNVGTLAPITEVPEFPSPNPLLDKLQAAMESDDDRSTDPLSRYARSPGAGGDALDSFYATPPHGSPTPYSPQHLVYDPKDLMETERDKVIVPGQGYVASSGGKWPPPHFPPSPPPPPPSTSPHATPVRNYKCLLCPSLTLFSKKGAAYAHVHHVHHIDEPSEQHIEEVLEAPVDASSSPAVRDAPAASAGEPRGRSPAPPVMAPPAPHPGVLRPGSLVKYVSEEQPHPSEEVGKYVELISNIPDANGRPTEVWTTKDVQDGTAANLSSHRFVTVKLTEVTSILALPDSISRNFGIMADSIVYPRPVLPNDMPIRAKVAAMDQAVEVATTYASQFSLISNDAMRRQDECMAHADKLRSERNQIALSVGTSTHHAINSAINCVRAGLKAVISPGDVYDRIMRAVCLEFSQDADDNMAPSSPMSEIDASSSEIEEPSWGDNYYENQEDRQRDMDAFERRKEEKRARRIERRESRRATGTEKTAPAPSTPVANVDVIEISDSADPSSSPVKGKSGKGPPARAAPYEVPQSKGTPSSVGKVSTHPEGTELDPDSGTCLSGRSDLPRSDGLDPSAGTLVSPPSSQPLNTSPASCAVAPTSPLATPEAPSARPVTSGTCPCADCVNGVAPRSECNTPEDTYVMEVHRTYHEAGAQPHLVCCGVQVVIGKYCMNCGTHAVAVPKQDSPAETEPAAEVVLGSEIDDKDVHAEARYLLLYYLQHFRDQAQTDDRYSNVADQLASDLAKLEYIMGPDRVDDVDISEPPAKVPRIDPGQAVLSVTPSEWQPAKASRIVGVPEDIAAAIEACSEEVARTGSLAPLALSSEEINKPIKEIAMDIHQKASRRRKGKQPQ